MQHTHTHISHREKTSHIQAFSNNHSGSHAHTLRSYHQIGTARIQRQAATHTEPSQHHIHKEGTLTADNYIQHSNPSADDIIISSRAQGSKGTGQAHTHSHIIKHPQQAHKAHMVSTGSSAQSTATQRRHRHNTAQVSKKEKAHTHTHSIIRAWMQALSQNQ